MKKKTCFKHQERRCLPYVSVAVVSIVVFSCAFWGFRYTFVQAENNGLFLSTPDYMEKVFSSPWPLSHLVGNYVLQFFHYPLFAPFLLGIVAGLTAFILQVLFRRSKRLQATVCISLVILTILLCSAALLNPALQKKERWNKLEYATLHHDWRLILSTVNPELTAEDQHTLPYVLLALAETGQLGNRMFHYAIQGPECMDMHGWYSQEGYFFNSILYECVGCPNEALHNTFQAAVYLPYGTSFGTLRQLIKFNYREKRTAMTRKYLAVISHSTIHKRWARRMMGTLPESTDASEGVVNESEGDHVANISNNLAVNLATLMDSGAFTPQNLDRLLCLLLADGELAAFVRMLDAHASPGASLPIHYQEALLVAQSELGVKIDRYKIDASVRRHYDQFLKAKLNMVGVDVHSFDNTYWAFYFE